MTPAAPDLLTRIRARLRGEISTEILEAYQRAGAQIHPLLDEAEARRFMLRGTDRTWWDQPRHEQLATLCLWNAFTLQTLADTLLSADADADPDTVGFAPRVTTDQALAYYTQVSVWLERSVRAQHDQAYDPDVTLPSPLPDWSPVEPCPPEHLSALLAALTGAQGHLTSVMAAFDVQPVPAGHREAATRLRAMFDVNDNECRALNSMYAPGASRDLHELIEDRARRLMENIYRLGQWLSMPVLVTQPPPLPEQPQPHMAVVPESSAASPGASAPAVSTPPALTPVKPLPANPPPAGSTRLPQWETEPWCASDARIRTLLQEDRKAVKALRSMWRSLRSQHAALNLLREAEALCSGEATSLTFATHASGEPLGHDHQPPYAPIYRVVQDFRLGGVDLKSRDEFTLMRRRGPDGWEVQVVVGRFGPEQGLDTAAPETP